MVQMRLLLGLASLGTATALLNKDDDAQYSFLGSQEHNVKDVYSVRDE